MKFQGDFNIQINTRIEVLIRISARKILTAIGYKEDQIEGPSEESQHDGAEMSVLKSSGNSCSVFINGILF